MKGLSVELIVRTSDDSFESRLSLPVDSTPEQRTGIAKMWMDALCLALKTCASTPEARPSQSPEEARNG